MTLAELEKLSKNEAFDKRQDGAQDEESFWDEILDESDDKPIQGLYAVDIEDAPFFSEEQELW